MNESQITLCALPSNISLKVRNIDVALLFKEALQIEKRMAKGANLGDERTRYSLVCDRIEFAAAALLRQHSTSRVLRERLGPAYFEALDHMFRQAPEEAWKMRLGANFFPTSRVKTHLDAFKSLARKVGLEEHAEVKRRTEFLRQASRGKYHVVEIQDGFSGKEIPQPKPGFLQRLFSTPSEKKEAAEAPVDYREAFGSQTPVDEVTDHTGKSHYDVVREQVLRAIHATKDGQQGAINFSNLKHEVITEVLHDFVYGKAEGTSGPLYVKVVYDDGSEARRFPLFCLIERSDKELAALHQRPELRVGLISARHPEMDSEVDLYWFRNQEISVTRVMAEIDELSYLKSEELFEQMRSEGEFRIGFYQTGFQPAVIGFYRALAEELAQRADFQPSLEVTPYFYYQGKYEQGSSWN